jgi:hypothetical protein
MAIPTVEEIITEIQDLLGDPSGRVITSAVALKGVQRGYRRLRQALLNRQIKYVQKEAVCVLSANTTSLTPATAGITDFGELVRLEERTSGTSDNYSEVNATERLPQRTAAAALYEYEWREDKWYFVGATTARQLKITYLDNAEPPSSGSVGIDGSFAFLSLYGGSVAGRTKQYDDEADRLMIQAVGSKLDDAPKESGELLRLCMAMVRNLQKTPIQPKPYGVGRTYKQSRSGVYVAAPIPEGSMIAITVTGLQDGENTVFTLTPTPASTVTIYRNGIVLKEGVGYTRVGNIVTFAADQIPASTDLLWANG